MDQPSQLALIFTIVALFVLAMPLGGYLTLLRFVLLFVRRRPVERGYRSEITVVVATHNEADYIEGCLSSIIRSTGQPQSLHIIVVDDGSTDETCEIVEGIQRVHFHIDIQLLRLHRGGKIAALNEALPLVSTDVVVFTDADAEFDKGCIENLVDVFADKGIGASVGLARGKRTNNADGGTSGEAVHNWLLRQAAVLESSVSSTVISNGLLYAVRHDLLSKIQSANVADDWYHLLQVMEKGYRVVVASGATAGEMRENSLMAEYRRTQRTISGGMNALAHHTSLLVRCNSAIPWFIIGHKVIRWFSPLGLVLLGVATILVRDNAFLFSFLAIPQASLYVSGVLGIILEVQKVPTSVFRFPAFYLLMNTAVILGALSFARGSSLQRWVPADSISE